MSRASKHDILQREKEIRDYLMRGIPISEFIPEMAEKWKCSELTIRRQYLDLMNELKAESKKGKEELKNTLYLRLERAYQKADVTNNIKNMIDATKEQARLAGLYDKEESKGPELPKFIEIEEKDFSKLQLVGDKVEEES